MFIRYIDIQLLSYFMKKDFSMATKIGAVDILFRQSDDFASSGFFCTKWEKTYGCPWMLSVKGLERDKGTFLMFTF